jgi:hypothetical protein
MIPTISLAGAVGGLMLIAVPVTHFLVAAAFSMWSG